MTGSDNAFHGPSRRVVFTLGCADLLLLLLGFCIVHLLNYGNLSISPTNLRLLLILSFVWFGVSLFAQKFSRLYEFSMLMGSGLLFKTALTMLFGVSLLVVGLHMTAFSRTMAYGSVLVFLLLEFAALAIHHIARGNPLLEAKLPPGGSSRDICGALYLVDGALLLAAFFMVNYLKRGTLALGDPYDDILLITMGLWIGSSTFTRKFHKYNFNDYLNSVMIAAKTVLFIAGGLALILFLFRLQPVSRLQAFGALPLFLAMEMFVFLLYVNYRRYGQTNGDIENPEQVAKMLRVEEEQAPLEPLKPCPVMEPAEDKLRHALEFFDIEVFNFIKSQVDLQKIDRCSTYLTSTDNIFNLDVLDQGRMDLVINLHKLNDIRWFNRYLLLAHEKLAPGGYLVGKAHTVSTMRDHYQSKYPRYFSELIYGLRFLWGRVFPKLPLFKKIYFTVSKGRGRMVSRAEVLGRLCFCGYKIVAEQEIGHRFFFIAQKIKRPCMDPNPTYGPLVKLKRTGLGGQPITVYKFRTMYPYSEYLQHYVYETCSLEKGGKFKNDFRVTGWGRFMRKAWLDELPMLWNWLRGDLGLVGVRPLSRQYLELYTDELKSLRKQVKPGLLPPFYADMPVTLEEIMASERKYIESYLQKSVSTQVRYFFRCVYNIVVKRRRSA